MFKSCPCLDVQFWFFSIWNLSKIYPLSFPFKYFNLTFRWIQFFVVFLLIEEYSFHRSVFLCSFKIVQLLLFYFSVNVQFCEPQKFAIWMNGVQHVLRVSWFIHATDSINRFLFDFIIIIIVSLICLLICCSKSGSAWNCILILLLHFRHLEIINSFDLIRSCTVYLFAPPHEDKTKQSKTQKKQWPNWNKWEMKKNVQYLIWIV